jgi:hypothetical protein
MDKPWHELNKEEQSDLIRRIVARLDEVTQDVDRLNHQLIGIRKAIENLEKRAISTK